MRRRGRDDAERRAGMWVMLMSNSQILIIMIFYAEYLFTYLIKSISRDERK